MVVVVVAVEVLLPVTKPRQGTREHQAQGEWVDLEESAAAMEGVAVLDVEARTHVGREGLMAEQPMKDSSPMAALGPRGPLTQDSGQAKRDLRAALAVAEQHWVLP